ncbi:MAG: cardiolipin synthase [Gammaproteobacteria bacterium]|nr:cardiolipin synthase [Gammaproteobacteria bacterium]
MDFLIFIIIVVYLLLAALAGGHALLYKRDPKAALSWIVICIFFPIIGSLFYFLFGINRVQTRARRLHSNSSLAPNASDLGDGRQNAAEITCHEFQFPQRCQSLLNVSNAITQRPLTTGNNVDILYNGDQAYPEMLHTIRSATQSVYLTTYIFDTDDVGQAFIEALCDAQRQGVDVKVLVDGLGEIGWPSRASTLLKKHNITVERFLPLTFRPPAVYVNLRNHRKILVVDGCIAFTGGMNISKRHIVHDGSSSSMVDVHFRLTGSIVSQLEHVFIQDWQFVTEEKLMPMVINQLPVGEAVCRTIVDGPNENSDKLATLLIGAVSAAQQRILIMTPYFLPSNELIAALQAAVLRGVAVSVVLPGENDSRLVHWATRNLLWQLLQFNIRVYYQPSPFVHSKLFIVDDYYALFGSANIDPRSLRLNFELDVEAYDFGLVRQLSTHIEQKIERSKEITLEELDARTFAIKVRDALAWLWAPYL